VQLEKYTLVGEGRGNVSKTLNSRILLPCLNSVAHCSSSARNTENTSMACSKISGSLSFPVNKFLILLKQ